MTADEVKNVVTGGSAESFPGQYEGEEVLIFVRRHWMAFVAWALLTVVMLTIPLVVVLMIASISGLAFFVGTNLIYTSLLICAFLLVTNAVFLTAWIEHYLDVAIITPERLIHISQAGLFNRSVAELSLLRIQDVSARTNGYFQTLFQYGQVIVESAGETQNFVMPYAPKPHIIANTILTLHDRLANQEGTAPVMELGEAPHKRHVPAHPEDKLPAIQLRDELVERVAGTRPPSDFHREHFEEDLIQQKEELDRRIAIERSEQHAAEQAATSFTSPNRLPPPVVTKIEQPNLVEGELSEGESVSLADER